MENRDTILTVNVVEKELVRAVHLLSKTSKKTLKGLVLVNKNYAKQPGRPRDTTGLFEEIICNFDNPDELQTVLRPYTDRLLAATCRYEEAIQDFGKIIPFLPYLHTPSPTALLWSTEKPLMRDRLKNYDESLVPKYQYMELHDLSRLTKLVKDFQYPVIVKPSGLAKSLFVEECDTPQELKERLDYTFKAINHAYTREQYPGKPGVLVEEMMQGEMYSIDAYITHDGKIFCLPPVKVITAHSLGLPGFYGHQCTTVTDLDEADIQASFATSRAAVKALNLSATTAHIELFRTPLGWKIIEVAARIGGHRDDLYREAYGINHFYNDLLIRTGKNPQMPTKHIGHAVAINIYAKEEGYIDSITGLEKARQISSVTYLRTHAKEGDLSLFANNGGDAIIDGILSNKDPKQLQKDITAVQDLIKITVRSKSNKARKFDYAIMHRV